MHKKRQKIDMTIKMREASYENFSNMTKRIVLSLNEDDDKEVFYFVLCSLLARLCFEKKITKEDVMETISSFYKISKESLDEKINIS